MFLTQIFRVIFQFFQVNSLAREGEVHKIHLPISNLPYSLIQFEQYKQ